MENTGRKTTIPVRYPAPIDWLLKNATGEELDYMNSLSLSNNFKILVNLLTKFRDYNVYTVFEFAAKTPEDLVVYRSYKKGEVDGLDNFLKTCKVAKVEIERRRKVKEDGRPT